LAAFLLGSIIFAQILYSLGGITEMLPEISPDMEQVGTVEALGDVLYTDYLFAFEMTAILLTAAVVGALLIAQFKVKNTGDTE
jgi:NADH-quinone oxidoreductase subunit J